MPLPNPNTSPSTRFVMAVDEAGQNHLAAMTALFVYAGVDLGVRFGLGRGIIETPAAALGLKLNLGQSKAACTLGRLTARLVDRGNTEPAAVGHWLQTPSRYFEAGGSPLDSLMTALDPDHGIGTAVLTRVIAAAEADGILPSD